MTNLTVSGEFLSASADERSLSYLLLPYGEVGRTSLGKVIASKGSVPVPNDISHLILNAEHNQYAPVGRFTSITDTEQGLTATVSLSNIPRADEVLTLAASGEMTGISVELTDVIIKNHKLVSAELTGAGITKTPAFPHANLFASDCGDDEPEYKEIPMETDSNLNAAEDVSVAPTFTQPAPVLAASTKAELGAVVFAAAQSGANLNAALAEVLTTNDAGKVYIADQEVGELWTARKTQRPLVDAVSHKPLNSFVCTGTKINRTLAVGNWAGNLTELPTGTFTTSREVWTATSKAVATSVAAELVEFGGESVISEAYAEAMDSYIVQTETELLTYLSSVSTAVSAATGAVAAVDKAAEILGAIGAELSIVAVSPDVMSALRSLKTADAPWWMVNQGSIDLTGRTISLAGITFTSNQALGIKTMLVLDKKAVDYRESKDIKFRAASVSDGGIDISFIKFRAQYVTDASAILKFTNVAGA